MKAQTLRDGLHVTLVDWVARPRFHVEEIPERHHSNAKTRHREQVLRWCVRRHIVADMVIQPGRGQAMSFGNECGCGSDFLRAADKDRIDVPGASAGAKDHHKNGTACNDDLSG